MSRYPAAAIHDYERSSLCVIRAAEIKLCKNKRTKTVFIWWNYELGLLIIGLSQIVPGINHSLAPAQPRSLLIVAERNLHSVPRGYLGNAFRDSSKAKFLPRRNVSIVAVFHGLAAAVRKRREAKLTTV